MKPEYISGGTQTLYQKNSVSQAKHHNYLFNESAVAGSLDISIILIIASIVLLIPGLIQTKGSES